MATAFSTFRDVFEDLQETLGRQMIDAYVTGFRMPRTRAEAELLAADPFEQCYDWDDASPASKLCQYCGRVIEGYHCTGCGGDTL